MAGRLLAGLRHRGPDDEGIEQPTPGVTLVHTRLAILDLSLAGHQPMHDHPPDGAAPNWVVFNGEIFNHRELRRELESIGLYCRTRCDTEVILHSYRAWGEECVRRFRGMFAICLVDPTNGVAYIYRDRLGIKPLYLYRHPERGLIFSSEIRALLALGPELISPCVNSGALESYFAQGAVHGYDTIVRGITMLRPATFLRIDLADGREIARRRYWQLPPAAAVRDRREEVEQLHWVTREAVHLHLISDAPLGVFLSGGVDSAAILTLACEERAAKLRTLTIGFDSTAADESSLSAETAAAFEVDHQTIRLSGRDVLGALSQALAAMDQPTVDGFNTYFVSSAARSAGLTVALSGLGGDELFGGYASFRDVPRAAALGHFPGGRLLARIGGTILPTRLGAKLMETSRRVDLLSLYLLRRELFLPEERRALHSLPEASDAATGLPSELLEELRECSPELDEINQVSFFELQLYMRHMLLRDADAFSMAAPIEYRVPFLDHIMVEAVFGLPGAWKTPDPRPKPFLIDVVGPRLPASVWRRPKHGFSFPWREWFARQGPLYETAREAAHDIFVWRNLGVEPVQVADTWRRFVSGDRRVSALQLLAFVTLRDYTMRHRLYIN